MNHNQPKVNPVYQVPSPLIDIVRKITAEIQIKQKGIQRKSSEFRINMELYSIYNDKAWSGL